MAESFRNLLVWQKAKTLAVEVYEVTKSFPKEELYSVTAQMRRSALSVSSNIAEGKGRGTDRDFKHFLMQARGSLYELENQLEIAKDLRYLTAKQCTALVAACDEVGRMLNGLIHALEQALPQAAGR